MLCLLGVMLSVLCLVSPAPHSASTARPDSASTACPDCTSTACPCSAILKETIQAVQNLASKGSSKVTPLNNKMEAGGNVTIYLEGFIEALNNSKERHIVPNLKVIQSYGESCTGWTSALKEHHWKAVEDFDFFDNLEYFLRFLGHNAIPDKKKGSCKGVQGTCPDCQTT